MMPVFSNPAGFWALLGLPALVAVHCLQQRSRSETVSTLFLLEALAPESRGGRSWDWWRTSRAFWLQVCAVLLATWILAGPRWVRGESAQTVVVVLDCAVSMAAFHDEAVRAAERKIAESASRAARTEWVIQTSDPREPALYRGPERTAAIAALAAWHPKLGTHDYAPVLRRARSLTAGAGETWFVTDSMEKVPPGQSAVGVGEALANVGFAGVTVTRDEAGGWQWRALVKNNAAVAQRREWWLEDTGSRSPVQTADLAPGALVELGGRFPEGMKEGVLALAPDRFTADDRLPLVRPEMKTLRVSQLIKGEEGAFFDKLLAGIDGVTLAPNIGYTGGLAPPPVTFRVARLGPGEQPPAGAGIFLARAGEKRGLLTAPVVAQRDPLVEDLNWQGLLGPGAANLKPGTGDETLLWQGGEPLAWLRPGPADTRQLVLNIDWVAGNAARLPAGVLLLRRFVEAVRAAQPGFYAANFDAGAVVPLAAKDREAAMSGGDVKLDFTPAENGVATVTRAMEAGEPAVLRAPGEAGFFTLRRGSEALVRGAVQFADARQGDFSRAGIFDTGRGPETAAAWERATRPDPWVPAWLLLLGGLLLASWWPGGKRGGVLKSP